MSDAQDARSEVELSRRGGNQRREEQRRIRQRQRRQQRQMSSYEPVGAVEFGGVIGFFQRHTRLFFIGGIILMVASLGAVFFPRGTPAANVDTPTATSTADASATATEEASATPTEDPIQRVYNAPPPLEIDPTATYEAVIHTSNGDVTVELLPQDAEGYVNNFVFLAQNQFYDGLSFHRVVPGFVAQAGATDQETGAGGPGYTLPPESNDLSFDEGVLAMATSPLGVSGSQFFVTLGPQPGLAGDFTVFGRVTGGLDVLETLPARDPFDDQPDEPGLEILGIDITEQPAGG
ncbi:MAG: peptidylprolyl isomerase [Dehalococcoidia bacterium]